MGPSVRHQLQTVPYGEVLLLENTRFHPEEEKNDPEFARQVGTRWDGPGSSSCTSAVTALMFSHAAANSVSSGHTLRNIGKLESQYWCSPDWIWLYAVGGTCGPVRQRCLWLRASSSCVHGGRHPPPEALRGWPADAEGTTAAVQHLPTASQSKHCQGMLWPPTPAVMKYARIANLAPSHVAIDHAPDPVEHHLGPCQQELNYLEAVIKAPRRPFCAIVGGSKVSSKIDVLHALIASCDTLIIGYEHAFCFILHAYHGWQHCCSLRPTIAGVTDHK